MIVNNLILKNVADVIRSSGKYVSLNLSGNVLTSIPEKAFDDCKSLVSVTIPNSVTSIEDHAFEDCSNLTSVTIPDIKDIAENT